MSPRFVWGVNGAGALKGVDPTVGIVAFGLRLYLLASPLVTRPFFLGLLSPSVK